MKRLILLMSLGAMAANAQVFRPRFELGSTPIVSNRPSGNFIGTIFIYNDTALIDGGGPLNRSVDHGNTWDIFTSSDGIGKGGAAAITVFRSTIFLTTIFDTSVTPRPTSGAGGGISYSTDAGTTWLRIVQPQDTATLRGPVIRTMPDGNPGTVQLVRDVIVRQTGILTDSIYTVAVKTNIDNVSFDIAVTDSSIWLPCFGGGLRVARILPGGTIGYFTPAPLPPDSLNSIRLDRDYDFTIDPIEHLNHRAFSVLAASDGIWAGTAGGVNHSTDGGLSWTRYTHANSGISGNFVVALGEQTYVENSTAVRLIWAATNRALGATEDDGLSYTADSGQTWKVVLRGPFVNNVAFDGKTVYAATDEGMYRSSDRGVTWEKFFVIVDAQTGDRTFHPEFASVGVQQDGAERILYFGNVDGLAISTDFGNSWTIRRAFRDPGIDGTPKSYAYPNPFSPTIDPAVVRFQFDPTGLDAGDRVTLKIYDFALDHVVTAVEDVPLTQTLYWTGRNKKGKRVANGTYVYVIEAGKKKFWGKVTVRN